MSSKNSPGGRSVRHVVRVTEAEEKQLLLKAAEAGWTVSRLLLESGLNRTDAVSRRVATNELFSMRRQLTGLATNTNQLSRHANSGGGFNDELPALADQIQAMVAAIDVWLRENS